MFVRVCGPPFQGVVVYRQGENSFDFVPAQETDSALLIGYLHLAFDSGTRFVRQVWGFHPHLSWKPAKLTPPRACGGRLRIETSIDPGTAKRIVADGEWSTYHDKDTGWVCIGDPQPDPEDTAVAFAADSIAVVANSLLRAIWLKPEWQP